MFQLFRRKHSKQHPSLTMSAVQGLFWASLVICAGFWALWYYFPTWQPAVSAAAAQSFLIGIVQVQAGIFAIAASFSVLYLQVSLEAYSLRASDLFLKNEDFPILVRDFIFTLVINSALALWVSDVPEFFPILFSLSGSSFFVASLVILLRYTRQVAESVSPEKIVAEMLTDAPYSKLSAESTEFLTPPPGNLYKPDLKIEVPGLFGASTQLGPSMKMLVDIARRMIDQFDHAVLNQILNGITAQNSQFSFRTPPEPVTENDILVYRRNTHPEYRRSPLTNEQIQENIRAEKKTLREAAYLAYLIGAFLQMLPAAIRANNKPAAKIILAAIGKVLNGRLFTDSFHKTNILNTVLRDHLLSNLELEGWLDLKLDAIKMVFDCLQLKPFYQPNDFSPGASAYDGNDPDRIDHGHALFAFFDGLFDKNKMDTELGKKIGLLCFDGIHAVTAYEASKGSPMIGDFALVLGNLGSQPAIHHQTIARSLESIGRWWAVAGSQGKVYTSAYSTLLRQGILEFIRGRIHYLGQTDSQLTMNSLINPFLDSLENIGRECDRYWQSETLEETLQLIYELGKYLLPDPDHAYFCAINILKHPVDRDMIAPDETITKTWFQVTGNYTSQLSEKSRGAVWRLSEFLKEKSDLLEIGAKYPESQKAIRDIQTTLAKYPSPPDSRNVLAWLNTVEEQPGSIKVKDWVAARRKEN